MSGFKRLVKNSISNIINGFSNVILGIVISPFLIKILSINDFSIWSLVLQTGAFFSLLGFSGQISVARYVTLSVAENNKLKLQRVINFGNTLSIASVVFSVTVLYLIYTHFFTIFNGIHAEQSSYAPDVFFVVSLSFIIGLLASVYNGYFTGIERNEIPAGVNLISRTILGVGIYISAHFSMMMMAITYFVINSLSYIVVYLLYLRFRKRNDNGDVKDSGSIKFKEFISYCFGVLVFNLSTFLIVNLNGVLIGRYAFKEYAWYALAITLVTAVVGFLNAALTPVLQPIVRLTHSDEKSRLNDFVYILTRAILTLSFTLLVVNFIVGRFVLDIWIGSEVASFTWPVFVFLLLTNLSRLLGAPLGLVYLAKGKQNEIIYLPLLEGAISVVMTFIFVKSFGVYASAMSMAVSTIIIMFIYSFKLIGIAALDSCKNKFRWLLAGGPLALLVIIFILARIQLQLTDERLLLVFYIVMTVLAVVSFAVVFKDIKRIKKILES